MQPNRTRERSTQYDAYLRYFEEFLPGLVGKLMMEDLKSLTCEVEIVVSDTSGTPWRLEIEDGRLIHVAHRGQDPQCRYLLNLETLIDVVTAKCSPREAFFDMRIEIEGDIQRGLELSTVLEDFFERFPFTLDREDRPAMSKDEMNGRN